jgi:hypothetical protein
MGHQIAWRKKENEKKKEKKYEKRALQVQVPLR